MEVQPNTCSNSETPLQLLLFVDRRPNSSEKIRQIRNCLKELGGNNSYDLQVIDVSDQPHLAEHFKLVATPTLIKIAPEPRQTLAGSNLVEQLEKCWSRWQKTSDEVNLLNGDGEPPEFTGKTANTIAYSAEVLRLSDEIFRLQQEKEELREQVQFKDRLIAMLAHDLRNPLTAASIALETLELGIETKGRTANPRLTPELMSQLLKHARTQTKAIDRMITDVLQAAKGSGIGFQIQPQELQLGNLCKDVLSQLKRQYQRKSQTIVTDIPSDLPNVYADPERVRQVLVNLIDNAIKYTPDKGNIHISILHRTTQKVQVSICDDGPGIPDENQELIFEDRFRLKRDEAKDGYGIGLSVCQRVIRAHYGQIWVDSMQNQGSCFHFTLPVYRM